MKTPTPTQAAKMHILRTYGVFSTMMSVASQRQLIRAYIAGVRHGKRNGK